MNLSKGQVTVLEEAFRCEYIARRRVAPGLRVLVDAGYLRPTDKGHVGQRFEITDAGRVALSTALNTGDNVAPDPPAPGWQDTDTDTDEDAGPDPTPAAEPPTDDQKLASFAEDMTAKGYMVERVDDRTIRASLGDGWSAVFELTDRGWMCRDHTNPPTDADAPAAPTVAGALFNGTTTGPTAASEPAPVEPKPGTPAAFFAAKDAERLARVRTLAESAAEVIVWGANPGLCQVEHGDEAFWMKRDLAEGELERGGMAHVDDTERPAKPYPTRGKVFRRV